MRVRDFGFVFLDQFLAENNMEISEDSYIWAMMVESYRESGKLDFSSPVNPPPNINLRSLGIAAEAMILRKNNVDWFVERIKELSSSRYDGANRGAVIELNSKAAELISGGNLCMVFPELKPLREAKKSKTPDFNIFSGGYVEVYCPQESELNLLSLKEQQAAQQGLNAIWTYSCPLTGQNGMARKYPANKIIDRGLNGKREKDQTMAQAVNLLWVDLIHGFNVPCCDTKPLKTVLHADVVYTGSNGHWHGFYGKKDASIFSPERTELRCSDQDAGFYHQQKEGLFRSRQNLHGAILFAVDGIVFYENPWCFSPLDEDIKRKITRLSRFRADFSWVQFGSNQLGSDLIENELAKIAWLYNRSP